MSDTPTSLIDRGTARLQPLLERLQRHKRWLPVLSFATGVISALLMKRGFQRMYWLLGALFVTWLVVGLLMVLGRRAAGRDSGLLPKLHFGTMVLAQSASQEVLFFVLPFYWWSTTFFSPNMFFFNLLLLVILATLVDPIFERLSAWPPTAMLLLALSNFAALNFALPVVLGLRNSWSLHLSVLLTVLLTVLFASYVGREREPAVEPAARVPPGNGDAPVADAATSAATDAPAAADDDDATPSRPRLRDRPAMLALRRRLITAGLISAGLMISIWLLNLQVLIPPAPLRVMDGAIATDVQAREPIGRSSRFVLGATLPAKLYCFTAIQAPRGLDEQIEHRWIHNGELVNTVPLKQISGGREQGYRTWSLKSRFPKDPVGDWSCEVRTAGGQIVGRVDFEIVPAGEG